MKPIVYSSQNHTVKSAVIYFYNKSFLVVIFGINKINVQFENTGQHYFLEEKLLEACEINVFLTA